MGRSVVTRVYWPIDDYSLDDGQSIYSYATAPVDNGRLGDLDWRSSKREKHDYLFDAVLLATVAVAGYGLVVYGAGAAAGSTAAGSVGGESAVAVVGVDTAVPVLAGAGEATVVGEAAATVGFDTASLGADAFYAESVAGAQLFEPVAIVAGSTPVAAPAASASGLTLTQVASGVGTALSTVAGVARDVSTVDASINRLSALSPTSQATSAGPVVARPLPAIPAPSGALGGLLVVLAGLLIL